MKVILLQPSKKIAKIKITDKKDFWYLKQIIQEGDLITTKTTRKLNISKSEDKQKVVKTSVIITIEVKEIVLNHSLKIKGKVISSSDKRISKGSYHSFLVRIGKIFKIEKKWTEDKINLLKEASKSSFSTKILACVIDDKKSNIAEISTSEPKYLSYPSDLGLISKKIIELDTKINPEIIVIASPSNLKKELTNNIIKKAPNLKDKIKIKKVSSGSEYGIKELIGSGEIKKLAEESKEKNEKILISTLSREIARDLAAYGIEKVKQAIDYGAVKELLISEKFFDSNRTTVEDLMKSVKNSNGNIHIITTESSSEKLDNLGGIAAILRYKC